MNIKIPGSIGNFKEGYFYKVTNGSTLIGALYLTNEGVNWRPYLDSGSLYFEGDNPLKNEIIFKTQEDLNKAMDGNVIIRNREENRYEIQKRVRDYHNPGHKTEWSTYGTVPFKCKARLDEVFEELYLALKSRYKVDRVGYYLFCNEGEIEYRVIDLINQKELR